MEELKLLKRKVERLEKRLDRAEAHGRALERVVKHIVGDASQRAFEFRSSSTDGTSCTR